MLWLMVFILWAIKLMTSGYAAGQPAAQIILFLLALLGVLQVIAYACKLEYAMITSMA